MLAPDPPTAGQNADPTHSRRVSADPSNHEDDEPPVEASETGAAVAVAIPAHVFTALRRQSSEDVRGRDG